METLARLMAQQQQFEAGICGNDGTLADLNTLEYALRRGIIGEGEECLDEVVTGNIEAAKMEMVDVLIFIATAFNHLEMTPEEVDGLARQKMELNQIKYYSDGEDLPVAEIMAKRKREWGNIIIGESISF